MLMLAKLGLLLFQIISMLAFIGSILAYRSTYKWFRGQAPSRCATIEEQQLLARYYPKEKFGREVFHHTGAHTKGGTMKDWSGMDLIGGIPVLLPLLAKPFLSENGDNRIEVICGKKRAYVIRLNDGYHIEAFTPQVEILEKERVQWKFGIPGPLVDNENAEILGQRHTSKKERRILTYDVHAITPSARRLIGCLVVLANVLLLWAMAEESLTAREWFVPFTLMALAGFIPMTLEKHRPREQVNCVRGIYRTDPNWGCIIGSSYPAPPAALSALINEHLKEGQIVTAHITTGEPWLLRIEELPDAWPDWRHQEHEKWLGNAVMCGLLALSWFVAHLSYPEVDRSNAQAWIEYASGGLCIAYGINLIRRLWQRRPVADRLSTS